MGRLRALRTRAAAAGGVTTLVDMPLNSIPATVSVAGFDAKRRTSDGAIHVDVGFWGGVVPGNAGHQAARGQRRARLQEFLCPRQASTSSGTWPKQTSARRCRSWPPSTCRSWCTPSCRRCCKSGSGRRSARLPNLAGDAAGGQRGGRHRPADRAGARVRRPHPRRAPGVAGAARVDPRRARARRGDSCETCPHYLTFDEDHIVEGATPFKCAPPIREPGRSRGPAGAA